MKQRFILFVSTLVLSIVLVNPALAYDVEVDGIYYNIVEKAKTAEVTFKDKNYNSYSGDIVLPKTITYNNMQYNVGSIGENAFYNSKSMTTIAIPETLKKVHETAFVNCLGLTGVYINDLASWCNIDFGNGVNENYLLYYAKNIYLNNNLLTDLIIPNGIEEIKSKSFSYCKNLVSVEIPNTVVKIGNRAFSNCKRLTKINIPESIVEIGFSAFENCSLLDRVDITNIGSWCKINFVTYNSNPTYYAKKLYLDGVLLENIEIPFNTTSILSHAFVNCECLKSIVLPNNISSIGSCVFSGCKNLKNFTIPSSISYISNGLLQNCSNIESIEMHDGITEIGMYAFDGCKSLKQILSCTEIGGSSAI